MWLDNDQTEYDFLTNKWAPQTPVGHGIWCNRRF